MRDAARKHTHATQTTYIAQILRNLTPFVLVFTPMRSGANNDIALSGERNVFIDQLPKVEEVKADGESLSREVRVALQRGVCTFQVRGAALYTPSCAHSFPTFAQK